MGDSNRNFNNDARTRYAAGGVAAAAAGTAGGNNNEPAERPLMQQRTTNNRSIGSVSFRNVANGGGSGNVTNIGRSSFRFAGGGILRQSSTPTPATSTSSNSDSLI